MAMIHRQSRMGTRHEIGCTSSSSTSRPETACSENGGGGARSCSARVDQWGSAWSRTCHMAAYWSDGDDAATVRMRFESSLSPLSLRADGGSGGGGLGRGRSIDEELVVVMKKKEVLSTFLPRAGGWYDCGGLVGEVNEGHHLGFENTTMVQLFAGQATSKYNDLASSSSSSSKSDISSLLQFFTLTMHVYTSITGALCYVHHFS